MSLGRGPPRRINALIDAKPAERRLLVEEAAGTAGVHTRRRETELKLDAEENLARRTPPRGIRRLLPQRRAEQPVDAALW